MTRPVIRRLHREFEKILSIINDGAEAYRGIIPADRWAEACRSRDTLQHEIESGVQCRGFGHDGLLAGVMGF